MKRHRHDRSVFLLTLALLAMIAVGTAGGNAQPTATSNIPIPDTGPQASIAMLSESQREALRQFPRIDSLAIDVNGAPAYVFGDLGRTQGPDANSVLEFLERMQSFINSEGSDSYAHVSTEIDQIGQGHYRFQQRIHGLPVIGAIMIVHVEQATHRVVGLNGHIATGEVETTARLSASAAFAPAIEDMRSSGKNRSDAAPRVVPPLDEPALVYFLTYDGNARLAWRATFTIEPETGAESNTLYVDAATGELLLRENQFDSIYREIYDYNKQNWKVPLKLEKLILREGGDIGNAPAEAKAVYPKLATVYNYLKNRLNRNSFDDREAKMIACIHANGTPAPAFWDCENQAAYFMDANSDHDSPTQAIDTVAHEFGHGVNFSSATLSSGGHESGMLNEAVSDIMGACIEAYERGYSGGATDEATLHKVWSIGEDWWTPNDPSRPLRSLRNPKSCDDANHRYVDHYPEMTIDTLNYEGSTLASLAFYLLAEGGMHPRSVTHVQVYGLGIPKAEQIFCRALTAYLTPFATFSDVRQCTHQAARDLYGSKSLEQAQVWYCWEAVGVPDIHLPSAREIGNGQSVDPSLDRPGWQYFMLRVPSGQGKLEIVASGGFGDADLYVKRGVAPTATNSDQASAGRGVAKSVRINNPLEGLWYIAVNVRTPVGFGSLVARYSRSSGHVRLYEKENNNSRARANRITGSNTTVVGRLNKSPDTNDPTFVDNDFFRVSVPAGKTVFITMTCPPGFSYKTFILDSNGNVLVDEQPDLGGYCGKFKTVAFNNNSSMARVIYAQVVPGHWGSGGNAISFRCDPTKDYYLDITW